MRKKNREKFVDITTSILEFLLRFAGAASDAMSYKKEFYNELNKNGFDRHLISNRVRALINSGHIAAVEESGRESIRLTRKGKLRILERGGDQEIDGKWRFISFDIPDELTAKRMALTRSLKRIGYKPVQKSLWASPYNKADQIANLVDELKINDYVANFRIEISDIEEHLKELFDEELP